MEYRRLIFFLPSWPMMLSSATILWIPSLIAFSIFSLCLLLSEADLSAAKLWKVNLSGADLSGANLGDALLPNFDLDYANLSGANLSRAKIKSQIQN